ncbi:hypothetical protein ACJJTC_003580 [Scirpophaga incertulas]
MESKEEKKVDEDDIVFLCKNSKATPQYITKLYAHADINRKRNRAAAAKRRSARTLNRNLSTDRKIAVVDNKERILEAVDSLDIVPSPKTHCGLSGEISDTDDCKNNRRMRKRSLSSSLDSAPTEGCGCSRRKRRKRSCGVR